MDTNNLADAAVVATLMRNRNLTEREAIDLFLSMKRHPAGKKRGA